MEGTKGVQISRPY